MPFRRKALYAVALLWALPAYGLNFRPTVRADHESLDCIYRRLELAIGSLPEGQTKRDIQGALWHIDPMLIRHGGPVQWGQIELGSKEEIALVCTQHGYANTGANVSDIANDLRQGVWRWIKAKLWQCFVASLWWLPIVAWLWLNRQKLKHLFVAEKTARQEREQEQIATHRAIESAVQDKAERRRLFNNPLIDRAHQRIKPLL